MQSRNQVDIGMKMPTISTDHHETPSTVAPSSNCFQSLLRLLLIPGLNRHLCDFMSLSSLWQLFSACRQFHAIGFNRSVLPSHATDTQSIASSLQLFSPSVHMSTHSVVVLMMHHRLLHPSAHTPIEQGECQLCQAVISVDEMTQQAISDIESTLDFVHVRRLLSTDTDKTSYLLHRMKHRIDVFESVCSQVGELQLQCHGSERLFDSRTMNSFTGLHSLTMSCSATNHALRSGMRRQCAACRVLHAQVSQQSIVNSTVSTCELHSLKYWLECTQFKSLNIIGLRHASCRMSNCLNDIRSMLQCHTLTHIRRDCNMMNQEMMKSMGIRARMCEMMQLNTTSLMTMANQSSSANETSARQCQRQRQRPHMNHRDRIVFTSLWQNQLFVRTITELSMLHAHNQSRVRTTTSASASATASSSASEDADVTSAAIASCESECIPLSPIWPLNDTLPVNDPCHYYCPTEITICILECRPRHLIDRVFKISTNLKHVRFIESGAESNSPAEAESQSQSLHPIEWHYDFALVALDERPAWIDACIAAALTLPHLHTFDIDDSLDRQMSGSTRKQLQQNFSKQTPFNETHGQTQRQGQRHAIEV